MSVVQQNRARGHQELPHVGGKRAGKASTSRYEEIVRRRSKNERGQMVPRAMHRQMSVSGWWIQSDKCLKEDREKKNLMKRAGTWEQCRKIWEPSGGGLHRVKPGSNRVPENGNLPRRGETDSHRTARPPRVALTSARKKASVGKINTSQGRKGKRHRKRKKELSAGGPWFSKGVEDLGWHEDVAACCGGKYLPEHREEGGQEKTVNKEGTSRTIRAMGSPIDSRKPPRCSHSTGETLVEETRG